MRLGALEAEKNTQQLLFSHPSACLALCLLYRFLLLSYQRQKVKQ